MAETRREKAERLEKEYQDSLAAQGAGEPSDRQRAAAEIDGTSISPDTQQGVLETIKNVILDTAADTANTMTFGGASSILDAVGSDAGTDQNKAMMRSFTDNAVPFSGWARNRLDAVGDVLTQEEGGDLSFKDFVKQRETARRELSENNKVADLGGTMAGALVGAGKAEKALKGAGYLAGPWQRIAAAMGIGGVQGAGATSAKTSDVGEIARQGGIDAVAGGVGQGVLGEALPRGVSRAWGVLADTPHAAKRKIGKDIVKGNPANSSISSQIAKGGPVTDEVVDPMLRRMTGAELFAETIPNNRGLRSTAALVGRKAADADEVIKKLDARIGAYHDDVVGELNRLSGGPAGKTRQQIVTEAAEKRAVAKEAYNNVFKTKAGRNNPVISKDNLIKSIENLRESTPEGGTSKVFAVRRAGETEQGVLEQVFRKINAHGKNTKQLSAADLLTVKQEIDTLIREGASKNSIDASNIRKLVKVKNQVNKVLSKNVDGYAGMAEEFATSLEMQETADVAYDLLAKKGATPETITEYMGSLSEAQRKNVRDVVIDRIIQDNEKSVSVLNKLQEGSHNTGLAKNLEAVLGDTAGPIDDVAKNLGTLKERNSMLKAAKTASQNTGLDILSDPDPVLATATDIATGSGKLATGQPTSGTFGASTRRVLDRARGRGGSQAQEDILQELLLANDPNMVRAILGDAADAYNSSQGSALVGTGAAALERELIGNSILAP